MRPNLEMNPMPSPAAETWTATRRSPRHKVNLAIRLFAVVQHRKYALQGRTHDLSTRGMGVYIPAELQPGLVVQVELVLPDSQISLGVDGIVRDSEGFRCGLEFHNLSPRDQQALTRYCELLSKSD